MKSKIHKPIYNKEKNEYNIARYRDLVFKYINLVLFFLIVYTSKWYLELILVVIIMMIFQFKENNAVNYFNELFDLEEKD